MLPISRLTLERTIHRLAQSEWATPISGLPAFAVRDEGRLLSALAEPFQSAGGHDRYSGVRSKAAALFRNLCKGHPLIDGNKRIAVTAMTVFLNLNGYETTYSNRELYLYALRVARHASNFPLGRIHAWVSRHTRLASAGKVEEDRSANQQLYDAVGGDLVRWIFSER